MIGRLVDDFLALPDVQFAINHWLAVASVVAFCLLVAWWRSRR